MVIRGINLFPFIEAGHPFYPHIQRFESRLSEHPLYDQMTERLKSGEKTTIHAEIKGRLLPEQGWELSRFYWSFQVWDESKSALPRALTLYYKAKTGRTEFHEFPDDPYLTGMKFYFDGHFVRKHGLSSEVSVLRYVPLRRLTFRCSGPGKDGAPVVGKFKRRSRFMEAYRKLATVSQAVGCAQTSFSVAAPVGLDEAHALFFQEGMEGEDLSSLIDRSNFMELLQALGALHADLHGLRVAGLPVWDFSLFLENLKRDIQWITFFRQKQKAFLDHIHRLLLREVPRIDPGEYAFCHGDFVCSQILKTNEHWCVIDFELCMNGDPYLEMAMFIASLTQDVPLFQREMIHSDGAETILQAASEAYLEGYQSKAPRVLKRKRLLWYRLCYEIYYLALMFKKDRFHPIAFDHAIGAICEISDGLQKEGRI